jgi:hypothetical protein
MESGDYDLELMQRPQFPANPARVSVFVQNIPITDIIDSHLGDLRPRS